MKKIRLVIISERTRYHFQKPLEFFEEIEIIHLYKYHYPDMDPNKFGSCLIQYKNVFDLYKHLQKIQPDLIQGLEPYYGYSRFKIPLRVLPIIFTTFFYSVFNKTPYFFHILENISPSKKYGKLAGWLMKKIAQIYSKKAKFIFYLNKGAKKNLLMLKIKPQKISYALWGIWGVNIDKFAPSQIANRKSHVSNLLFVGRLIEQKGLQDLLKALPQIVQKISDIKLNIVGAGSYENHLQKLVKQLCIEKYCRFVGQKQEKKLINYYQQADVLVTPSRSLSYSAEQIGMVNIEAMACGVPVVSTNSGSIPEYVLNNKTGLLVPEKSPKSLAKAIIKLFKDKSLKNKISKNCRKYILNQFNSYKNVKKLEKIIIRNMDRT